VIKHGEERTQLIIAYLPGAGERVVLDAGCGEGYYLRRLREHLAEQHRAGVGMPVLPGRVSVLLSHVSPVRRTFS
jgi:hypothetical protein